MRKVRWPGEWKVVCDVCGFWHSSNDVRKRWDGAIVCRKDFETRHPQDFLRVRAETVAPPYVRPEPTDVFTDITYAET